MENQNNILLTQNALQQLRSTFHANIFCKGMVNEHCRSWVSVLRGFIFAASREITKQTVSSYQYDMGVYGSFDYTVMSTTHGIEMCVTKFYFKNISKIMRGIEPRMQNNTPKPSIPYSIIHGFPNGNKIIARYSILNSQGNYLYYDDGDEQNSWFSMIKPERKGRGFTVTYGKNDIEWITNDGKIQTMAGTTWADYNKINEEKITISKKDIRYMIEESLFRILDSKRMVGKWEVVEGNNYASIYCGLERWGILFNTRVYKSSDRNIGVFRLDFSGKRFLFALTDGVHCKPIKKKDVPIEIIKDTLNLRDYS